MREKKKSKEKIIKVRYMTADGWKEEEGMLVDKVPKDYDEEERRPLERPEWTLRKWERKWRPRDYVGMYTITWPTIRLVFPIDRRFKHNICSYGLPQFYGEPFKTELSQKGDLIYLYDKVIMCRDGKWRKCKVYRYTFTYCGRSFSELFYYDKKERSVSATFGRETLARLVAFDEKGLVPANMVGH